MPRMWQDIRKPRSSLSLPPKELPRVVGLLRLEGLSHVRQVVPHFCLTSLARKSIFYPRHLLEGEAELGKMSQVWQTPSASEFPAPILPFGMPVNAKGKLMKGGLEKQQ